MFTIDQILQIVDSGVKQISFGTQPKGLYEPINYILSLGGKRIRPALTLIACNLFTDNINDALDPALAMEVFHNFTLLHDDLMDNSDKRRNKETVHKKWNQNTAILSGDAMLIGSYKLIEKTDRSKLEKVFNLFNQTALEICEGQQFDMEFADRTLVTEEEYIEMIRLKTAVLLACCLKTGAIIGGASDNDAEILYQYGINLGLAFQLQDDLLDTYGNSNSFGKKIGGDIISNKKTFLLIQALKFASKDQQSLLKQFQENLMKIPDEEKIKTITSLYDELDIKKKTSLKIDYYFELANKDLSKLDIPEKRLSTLFEINNQLINRNV